MPKSSVQLSNRAPETQLVLKKIHGWGINWGVTIVLGLFIALLFATFQFKFPKTETIQVKIENPLLVKVFPSSPDFQMEKGVLELDGISYNVSPDKDAGRDGYFSTKTAIPLQANSSAQLEAIFTQKVNILSIIFEGIF